MTNLFKKSNVRASRLFKKAGGDIQRAFKKGGIVDKKIAGGLGSIAHGIKQGVNIGNKIVGAVEHSPFGTALTPITSAARGALGAASMVGNAAGAGKSVIRAAYKGNPLEAAKNVQDAVSKIKYA